MCVTSYVGETVWNIDVDKIFKFLIHRFLRVCCCEAGIKFVEHTRSSSFDGSFLILLLLHLMWHCTQWLDLVHGMILLEKQIFIQMKKKLLHISYFCSFELQNISWSFSKVCIFCCYCISCDTVHSGFI